MGALDRAWSFLKNDEDPGDEYKPEGWRTNPYGDDEWEAPYRNADIQRGDEKPYFEAWDGEREWLRHHRATGNIPKGGWGYYGDMYDIFPELRDEEEAAAAAAEKEEEDEEEPEAARPAAVANVGDIQRLVARGPTAVARQTRPAYDPSGVDPGGMQSTAVERRGEHTTVLHGRGSDKGKYRSAGRDTSRGKRFAQTGRELRDKEAAGYWSAPENIAQIAADRANGTGVWGELGGHQLAPEGHVTVRSITDKERRHIPAKTYKEVHPRFKAWEDEDGS